MQIQRVNGYLQSATKATQTLSNDERYLSPNCGSLIKSEMVNNFIV